MNKKLQDLAKIYYGKSPGEVISRDGCIPIVGTGGVYGFAIEAMFDAGVVVARKGSLGKPSLQKSPFWAVDTTYAVIPNQDIDIDWLYYSLLNFDLTKLNEATGVPSISREWLSKINFRAPSTKEQKKIADCISSVDTTIEKTEALIEKYQQIKAGLMHDLFTRGVLPDGKLRPTREQAPELYRETGIGWIPKEWTVRRNADLCQRICVGIVIQPTQYYVEDGIPAFRSANIREHGIDKSNFVFISSAANNLLIKSQVRAGDIISVRTGYPGTSAVVPLEFDGANCIDILIATPGGEVSSDYLCAWINSSFGKGQVFRQQGGMAQQHFNVGEMKELMVAFPDVDEQVRIEKILNNFSAKLKKESDFLNKIHFQKKGLMHDLLTGKVAVKVDEAQEEHV